MILQGRDLRFGLQGDDVRLLQSELRLLGQDLPERERLRAHFDEGTQAVVRQVQNELGLEPTGVVDERTANLINRRVGEQPRRIALGLVRHRDGTPLHGLRADAFDRALRQDDLRLGGGHRRRSWL